MRKIFPSLLQRDPGADEEGGPERGFRRAAVLVAALVLVWLAISLLPNPRTVAVPQEATATGLEQAQNGPPDLIGPGYIIGLLLLAAGGTVAVFLRRRDKAGLGGNPLHELGRLRTGPQQNLHLISCGDDILLIGATPQQVSLIKRYPADLFGEEVDVPVAAQAAPDEEGFLHVLNRYTAVRSYRTNTLYPKSSGGA